MGVQKCGIELRQLGESHRAEINALVTPRWGGPGLRIEKRMVVKGATRANGAEFWVS
jgi:hypothetical protein